MHDAPSLNCMTLGRGGVRTIGARLQTPPEEGAQRGLLLRHSSHHRLERPTHVLAGALRGRRPAAGAATEAPGAREIGHERCNLLFGPLRPLILVEMFG